MCDIEATYRIVTPMFIGDAQQKATVVRPPSVKGALRFWWRALNWSRCLAEAGDDEAAALVRLHKQESRLFGRASIEENGEQVGGQGCFLLRVRQRSDFGHPVTDWPSNNTGSGYLGYGLFRTNQQGPREGVQEGFKFKLELRFRPKAEAKDVASVRKALQVWGLLGGLGSRVRRGFGSVSLLEIDGENQLLTRAAYEEEVQALLEATRTVRAWSPFTAFCAHARFRVLADGRNPRHVHNEAGQLYRQHRLGSGLKRVDKAPFGLPLQNEDSKNRRASPLLFHVHTLTDDECLAVVLYLPAMFHHKEPYRSCCTNPDRFYRDVARFVETTAEERT